MTDSNRPVDPAEHPFTHLSLKLIGQELREAANYESGGKSSRSLVKSQGLSMVLLAFKEGAEMKEHHAPGPATAIVLEGEISFAAEENVQVLGPLESVVFSPELQHSVKAQKETLMLLVIGHKA